jgi:aminomethyltransferase
MEPRDDLAVTALRSSVVITRLDHVHAMSVHGADARRGLEFLCATSIRIRDGQLQHVLMMDEAAHCLADAFVLCDDEGFEVLYEGPSPGSMMAHIAQHLPFGWDVHISDRSESHRLIAIDGPFAWELLSRVVGPEVVGLPYRTFFHSDSRCCLRAGKTGEYGYVMLVSLGGQAALEAELWAGGADLDVAHGTVAALDVAALENFFFNIRQEGRARLSPLELQLQWRVQYAGDGVGLTALRQRRESGRTSRVTTVVAPELMCVGDDVTLDGSRVGTVLNAARSDSRGEWVALALLDLACAVPGIHGFRVANDAGETHARSVAPPVLNNRSIFVNPQMHSYATRGEIAMPGLARP